MFKKVMINSLLALIRTFFLVKIQDIPEFYEEVEDSVVSLEKLGAILTDKNPNDKAQLIQFWKENKGSIGENSLDTALKIIRRHVDDEHAKNVITELIEIEILKKRAAAKLLPRVISV